MGTDYFTDYEESYSSKALPSPADTPYHSLSRRTSRYTASSSDTPSSPVPFPPDPQNGSGNGDDNEEIISILDPRRLTPTLQANLVSEILNLRRELDSKHKFIEELESNLHTCRNENDSLTSQLSSSTKENRAVKRQLQQLENGTLAALEEIAGEKDKATASNVDLKNKLEAMEKKLRAQEDDSTRVHDMWARDKEVWTGEKLMLERRVHVSDSRVKMLLEEFAMQDVAHGNGEAGLDSEGEDMTQDNGLGHESDTASIRSSPQRRPSTRIARHSRNHSSSSYRSTGRAYRMSLMSGTDGRLNGLSLADELTFDEEDEDLGELELDSDDYPENEMRARRALESRQSLRQDDKAKRVLGLSREIQQVTKDVVPPSTEWDEPIMNERTESPTVAVAPPIIQLIWPPIKPIYVDTGVQFSPPPSPVRPESAESIDSTPPPIPPKSDERASPSMMEVEANQSRKRVSVPAGSLNDQPFPVLTPCDMTSISTQTVDHPLSPPATPIVALSPKETQELPETGTDVTSVAVQTEEIEELEEITPTTSQARPPLQISIPSIAIHAPTSAPSSPKEPILPPGTKCIATQTSSDLVWNMRSVSTQTDPIRVDQRLNKLPLHLQPSTITSRPTSPATRQDGSTVGSASKPDIHQPVPHTQGKEKSSTKPSAHQDLIALLENAAERKIENRYPGNNDNGPLTADQQNILNRPFRTSSLFAGFDGPSSDEDAEVSDDEYGIPRYATPMLSSRNVKSGRVFNSPPTPVPEDKEVVSKSRPSEDSISTRPSERTSFDQSIKIGKSLRTSSSLSRQPSVRRSAMIHNGSVAHMRSRSPSIGSVGSSIVAPKPPFQIPTRSSSRKIGMSKSEGSQSPTPRGNGAFLGRRPYGMKQHQRKDSLRKVRSAAVIPKIGRTRSRSPPLPATPLEPPSPDLPPLPTDMITGHRLGHRPQLSTHTSNTNDASVTSSAYQASVVDAIAATMVGEWMWKYVRKRKAFGGPESPADLSRAGEDAASISINGVRHRRWVWISPYERAILWNSKQPTTSQALIGKSGRKLVIQSVLDVADNTPAPKNAGEPLFNRSILILTPARALKFTTTSRDRHYLWLTALSFLAHSTSPIPELGPVPPAPPPVQEVPYKSSGAILRRTHVRDSVRLAKDKANPVTQRRAAKLEPMPDLYPQHRVDRPAPDAADPPTIPLGPFHGRKRSSTGPSAPPPSVPFRSFSHQQVPSLYSSGSSDKYSSMQPPSVPSSVYNGQSVIASTRTSEASSATRQHFFDTMGTVRMEAFIDNSLNDRTGIVPKPRASRRRGNSNWSASTNDHSRAGGVYEDFMHESSDPFRGF